MATERNKIGTFEGIPVYKTSGASYVGNKNYLDDKYIYLVNGELIQSNIVFASYDGNYVHEYPKHKHREYYVPPKVKPVDMPTETTKPIFTYEAGTAEDILASVYTNNLEGLMYNEEKNLG